MTDNTEQDFIEVTPNETSLTPMNDDLDFDDDTHQEQEQGSSDLDDALNKAFDKAQEDSEDKEKKEPEKPVKKIKEDKPEAEKEEKPKVQDADEKPAEEKVRDTPKPSEGKKSDSAPSQFLPEARDKWINTPNEVKAEVKRFIEDVERERHTYQEHVNFREELKDYEALAKQHNTTIKQSLDNYVDIERKFLQSPADGFKQLLSNLQMQPTDAIAGICQAIGVSPQTLAQHITQSPQTYQPRQAQQSQQDFASPQVSAMEQKIAALEQKIAEQENSNRINSSLPVIEKFAEENPDYNNVERIIAIIAKSGIINAIHGNSLTFEQRLSEAYRMAGGKPPSRSDEPAPEHSHPEKTRPEVGKLSIGGSPNAGILKTGKGKKSPPTIDEALENAWRRSV